MTTDKTLYGTSTSITCTLASLASGSARSCAAIDNTTDLFVDAILSIAVRTSASAPSGDKACYVYLYGSEDGTNFNGSSGEAVGTDAPVTLDNPSNLLGPFAISCPAESATYRLIIGSIAAVFGGVMPRKWGFVLKNATGQTLDATEGNHVKTYTGIYNQSV